MRTLSFSHHGGPEVLALVEKPTVEPAPGEVAIDVAYAGINFAEVLYRRGAVAGLEMPFTPGIEVAGRIREIGAGVTGFAPGQRVAGLSIVASGGYAESVNVPAALVVPVPDDMPLHIAAATPSNTTTARLILDTVARFEAGESLVVHAAAGGVGSVIGQSARALGAARVIGTVGSEGKLDYARKLGYDDVFVASRWAATAGKLAGENVVDVVIDPVGGEMRLASLEALRPGGRLIAMGNASGADDVPLSSTGLWLTGKAVVGFNLALLSATDPEMVGRALRTAVNDVADGSIRIDVTDVVPLEHGSEAHRRLESRSTTGKLVLEIRGVRA